MKRTTMKKMAAASKGRAKASPKASPVQRQLTSSTVRQRGRPRSHRWTGQDRPMQRVHLLRQLAKCPTGCSRSRSECSG